MKKLDINKPVQTRDGRNVRIICTDAKGLYPVIALVKESNSVDFDEKFEEVITYTLDGKYNCNFTEESDYDLINIPEKKECWVNIYNSSHLTKEEADNFALSNRKACVKVEYEEGQGLI